MGTLGGQTLAISLVHVLLRDLNADAAREIQRIMRYDKLLDTVFHPLSKPTLPRDVALGLWRVARLLLPAFVRLPNEFIPWRSSQLAVSDTAV